MKNKERLLKYLEEFELVNPERESVFVEKDINIEITTGKNGKYEYHIYNKDGEEIGIAKSKKTIELNSKYKKEKQKEISEDEFDFSSDDLKIDIDKMLEKQNEKERMERVRLENEQIIKEKKQEKNINQPNNDDKNSNEDKNNNKENNRENKKVEGNVIEKEELQEQGYNINTYTLIKDQNVIDSMLVENYDPRSVIVAEHEGQIKFLAREVGTGKIMELPQKTRSSSAEEVNEFENGIEKTDGSGTKITLANCPDTEFSITKNGAGQLEVGRIDNIDGMGRREVIPVATSSIHPTMEEYNRAKYEKYGYEFDDAIMTGQEIEARLADEKESIRDEVNDIIDLTPQNPTKQELEEIIEQEKDEYEQEQEDDEREEEDDEWVPWRPRSH